mgnify:CR=1 FL=1
MATDIKFPGEESYVFWSYDLFPYTISSKILKWNEDGSVKTVFGKHTKYNWFFILHGEDATNLREKIDNLKCWKAEDEKELTKKYKEKLKLIFNIAGVKHPKL